MHPPLSLIFFFIFAGLSIGSFTLIFVLNLITGDLDKPLMINRYISLLLIGLGAFFASFHLGHKMRAWKAIRRFGSSWLSREAVFSGAFGFFILISIALSLGGSEAVIVTDILALASGWLSTFSTAMIYTNNRFVPEWNTSLNTLYFLNMYMMLGSGLASCILFRTKNEELAKISVLITLILIFSALLLRISYHVRQSFVKRPTLNDALNLPYNREIRVLDRGSTTDNYCTTEFNYEKGKRILGYVQFFAYTFTFVIPLFLYLYNYTAGLNSFLLPLSLIALIVGSFAERWCFFVEGKHVQNLYYGLA